MGDQDFFLSPDDAQTMGNIDYMRTTKRTRRTFPKTLKNKDGFAVENIVSSIEDRNDMLQGNNQNTSFNPTSQDSQPQAGFGNSSSFDSTKTPEERRKPDNSMDMFRNMAKSVRGKK